MLPSSLHVPRCCETSERLSEFLDDELDETTRHEIALHLGTCDVCAQLTIDLAATIRALHGLGCCSEGERDLDRDRPAADGWRRPPPA